jgi:hypothetical protein
MVVTRRAGRRSRQLANAVEVREHGEDSPALGGRVCSPSLLQMRVTCFSTAGSVITNASAMPRLELPSAIAAGPRSRDRSSDGTRLRTRRRRPRPARCTAHRDPYAASTMTREGIRTILSGEAVGSSRIRRPVAWNTALAIAAAAPICRSHRRPKRRAGRRSRRGLDELERRIRCVGVQRNQVLDEVGSAPPAQSVGPCGCPRAGPARGRWVGSGSRRSRSGRARRPGGPGMARRDAEAA